MFDVRTEPTLKTIIRKFVKPGTLITSDKFSSYVSFNEVDTLENNRFLADMNYRHQCVNHKRNFVDPTTGAHTNSIEGCWEVKVKQRLKAMRGLNKEIVPAYLHECLWRSWFFNPTPTLMSFSKELSPPSSATTVNYSYTYDRLNFVYWSVEFESPYKYNLNRIR